MAAVMVTAHCRFRAAEHQQHVLHACHLYVDVTAIQVLHV